MEVYDTNDMNSSSSIPNNLPIRTFSDFEKAKWRSAIMGIYKRMRAQAENGPHDVVFGNITLTVLPNVYAPLSFTDTRWFAEQLRDIVGRKSLLEIGTGTGAIAILCAQNGSCVVATDINPDAVKNAKCNIERHHLNISVREGDLYEPITKNEKFDFIFWAHPFNNWETPVEDMLLRSGLDYQYESLKGYIRGAKEHLSTNGKLLIGTGDTADLQSIAETATEAGYSLKLLKEITMPLTEGSEAVITDLIYEFIPKQ